MIPAFYRHEDGLYHPLAPASGFWNRKHQNGVALGALLAMVSEAEPAPAPMRVCRVTVDIMRAVPFEPIAVVCETVRSGPRLQVLETRIDAGGETLARASVLRLREAETPPAPEAALPYPPPEASPETPITSVLGAGRPMETRVITGSRHEVGPSAFWTRINAEIVEGRPIPAIARAMMPADVASMPSSVMSEREWSFANLDLSAYFIRPPVGEWVLTEARTETAGNGVALVSSILADRDGVFGRAHQTLFVAARS